MYGERLRTVEKVAKNTSVMLVGNLLFRLLSLLVTIYLAKYLGVEGFGRYNFVFAYLGFFVILTDLGLGDVVVREMSRNEKIMSSMLGNVYMIKVFLSAVAILLSITVISFMDYPQETINLIYAASFILLFQSFSDIYKMLFLTRLKMGYDVVSKIISKIFFCVLVVVLIIEQAGLMELILAFALSELLRTLLNLMFSRKIVAPVFSFDFEMWKKLFRESLPIALSGVFLVIYHRIDVLMLSMMQGDIPVGLYSAAYKLAEPIGLFPYAVVVSLFPVMSRYFKESSQNLFMTYEIGIKILLILMLPISVGIMLLSAPVIDLIYHDPSFSGSVTALQILIWSVFFAALNYLLTTLLTSINKQRLNTLSMGFCVFINIVLNYLLIPVYSYNGASVATVITEVILFLISIYFVSTHIGWLKFHSLAFKPLISCLLMGLLTYYGWNVLSISVFIIIPLVAAVYFLSLFGMRTFSDSEMDVVKKLLRL